MSVTTTADEAISSAKKNVGNAYTDLLTLLNPDTWGNNSYTDEYKAKIHDVLKKLLEIRSVL